MSPLLERDSHGIAILTDRHDACDAQRRLLLSKYTIECEPGIPTREGAETNIVIFWICTVILPAASGGNINSQVKVTIALHNFRPTGYALQGHM